MQVLLSPWDGAFRSFSQSVRRSATLAAPFITRGPLEQFVSALRSPASVSVRILTDLKPESLVRGFVDCAALSRLAASVGAATVRSVPGLHAKAYVADDHTAIVTSANLTTGGVRWNRELGVVVSEPEAVREIAGDLAEYSRLGSLVPGERLAELGERAEEERRRMPAVPPGEEGDGLPDAARPGTPSPLGDAVLALRAGEATTTIFGRAVLYALRRRGAMTTVEIHDVVRRLLPDLCDDRVDRVIGGVSFGKKWKHHVRNAQQRLQQKGAIRLVGGVWRVASGPEDSGSRT